jgi:hypothetical protein
MKPWTHGRSVPTRSLSSSSRWAKDHLPTTLEKSCGALDRMVAQPRVAWQPWCSVDPTRGATTSWLHYKSLLLICTINRVLAPSINHLSINRRRSKKKLVVHSLVVSLIVGVRVESSSAPNPRESPKSGIALVPFLFCKTSLIWIYWLLLYLSTLFKHYLLIVIVLISS